MNGVLIVDKPSGLTSHDVVNRVRRILGQRSVGHLGTLDPLATGLLPVVVGNYTRLAQFYSAAEKCYEGIIRFGFATDTYDSDGEPTTPVQSVGLNADEVCALAAQFLGVIEQMPPPFSAKKIHGVPAYKLARKQKEVVLKAVQVEIKQFDVVEVNGDRVRFSARVASGTYIRSVAHEMGVKLGCGAHLESLRRTAVAEFTIAEAKTLEQITEQMQIEEGVHQQVTGNRQLATDRLFLHPRLLLPHMPSVAADEATAARIRNGRTVNLPELSQARLVKVFSGQTDLIAIVSRVAGTLFHPRIVLASEPASEPAIR
ncbi:MAG TPA: tRNA pseudouridine(55) synthase TruB [Candidatus Sulfotelmatobacter sp.]